MNELEEMIAEEIDEFPEITRKSKARIRHCNDVNKLRRKIEIAKNRNYYRCGMYYDEDTERLYDPGNVRMSKTIRKLGNRALRKSKTINELPPKGNQYRKAYEYWWEIT